MSVQGKQLRGAFDTVVLAGNRTLSMLMVMGIIGSPSTEATGEMDMTLIDVRLAQELAGRAFPAGNASGLTA